MKKIIVGLTIFCMAFMFILAEYTFSTQQRSEKAIQVTQRYMGKDNKGFSLMDLFKILSCNCCQDENFLKDPTTYLQWIVEPLNNTTFKVTFAFEINEEETMYVFGVDIDNSNVWGINNGAQMLIEILDYYYVTPFFPY
jgi:hypothetical protein